MTSGPEGAAWLVTCDHLGRVHGSGHQRVVALDDVTCRVGRGARVAVTGPSGSGKSTLLHLMAGLDRPTSGHIGWPGLGGDPVGHPTAASVVFQGPSLVPDLDVRENVGLPLLFDDEPLDAQGSRARVDAALARLDIDGLGAALPDELSGGQAQRVAVARVLVCRPRLMLADEPTGQLDAATAHLVMAALLDTADDLGAALVVATHDPRIADRLDEQWPMRDGRLDPGDATPPAATPAAAASHEAGDQR